MALYRDLSNCFKSRTDSTKIGSYFGRINLELTRFVQIAPSSRGIKVFQAQPAQSLICPGGDAVRC